MHNLITNGQLLIEKQFVDLLYTIIDGVTQRLSITHEELSGEHFSIKCRGIIDGKMK